MKFSLRCSYVCAIVSGLTTSCRPAADIQPNDLRTYTLPRQASPARSAAQSFSPIPIRSKVARWSRW